MHSDQIFLQERSLADIATYAILSLGMYNNYNGWMDEYIERAKQLQQSYKCVIYLSGRKNYTVENDGVRSINKNFSIVTDLIIKNYVDSFSTNVVYVDTPLHEERIEIISKKLEELQSK